MLGWALTFAILSLVAGLLGFFALAGLAASIAKVLFLVFLVLLVASFGDVALRGQSVVGGAASRERSAWNHEGRRAVAASFSFGAAAGMIGRRGESARGCQRW